MEFRVKSIIAITPVPACGTPGPKEVIDFFTASLNELIQAIKKLQNICKNK
jgi:hypothetical protein